MSRLNPLLQASDKVNSSLEHRLYCYSCNNITFILPSWKLMQALFPLRFQQVGASRSLIQFNRVADGGKKLKSIFTETVKDNRHFFSLLFFRTLTKLKRSCQQNEMKTSQRVRVRVGAVCNYFLYCLCHFQTIVNFNCFPDTRNLIFVKVYYFNVFRQ